MPFYTATVDVTFEADSDAEAEALSFSGNVLMQAKDHIVEFYISNVVNEEGETI